MNIELKRISHYARLSQETEAFAADIWIDGRKVGTADNSGHGGSTNYFIQPIELCHQAEAYAQTLPPTVIPIEGGEPMTIPMTLEHLIDRLLTAHLNAKFERAKHVRMCNGKTAFRLKGDRPGAYWIIKAPFTPAMKVRLIQKYGDKLESILNETIATEPK